MTGVVPAGGKMILASIGLKWDAFRRRVLHWQDHQSSDQVIKVDRVRERSISILQKRYGYTREEAISQLDKHYTGTWLG